MKRRRAKLICRWLGVVILVLWGMTFIKRVVFTWNCIIATPSGGGRVTFYDSLECSRGLIVYRSDQHAAREMRSGVSLRATATHPLDAKVFLFGLRPAFSDELRFGPRWIAPATIPLGLSAMLIGYSFWRRYPKGHCAKCGYDLSGITEQCPECGRMVRAGAP